MAPTSQTWLLSRLPAPLRTWSGAGETVVLLVRPPRSGQRHDILCMEATFVDTGSAVNTYNNATNGATNTTFPSPSMVWPRRAP